MPDTNRVSLTHERAAVLTILAMKLAARAAVADIESECAAVHISAQRWWDIRPMFDHERHPPAFINQSSETLAYALASGLVARHPDESHLVRVEIQPV